MGIFDKIANDIFDDGQPRRSRAPKKTGDDRTHIGDILGAYYYKEDLQDLCDEAGLRTSGTKEELIEDLLENSEYTVEDFLNELDVEQLKDLCEELDEKVSGTKDELVKRIIPHIDMDESAEETAPKKDIAPPVAPASVQVPPVQNAANVPTTVIPQIPLDRENELQDAKHLEYAKCYNDAISIYKKYKMWDDVNRCNIARKEFQAPQTKIDNVTVDHSVHTSISDSRNYTSTTNIDNRDAVINRSQIGGTPVQRIQICPFCGIELNYPEPPRFCPNCRKQIMQ